MRFTNLAGCLMLLALPLCADSKWGMSGCTPASEPVGSPSAKAVYEWKLWPDNRDWAALYCDGEQVGLWDAARQKYRKLLDWNAGTWGDEEDSAPIAPPVDMVREPVEKTGKLGAWQLQGVVVDEMCRHTRHSINGRAVAEETGLESIGKGVLPDDSAKLYLSVWSRDPGKRAAVVADLRSDAGLWKWVNERCHLWAGDSAHPDHFLAKDRQGQPLFAIDGEPTISLQDPQGVELWHDAGYTQGPKSLQAMRKRDPNYTPDKSPGPSQPDQKKAVTADDEIIPLALLGAAGVLGLIVTRRKREAEQ